MIHLLYVSFIFIYLSIFLLKREGDEFFTYNRSLISFFLFQGNNIGLFYEKLWCRMMCFVRDGGKAFEWTLKASHYNPLNGILNLINIRPKSCSNISSLLASLQTLIVKQQFQTATTTTKAICFESEKKRGWKISFNSLLAIT